MSERFSTINYRIRKGVINYRIRQGLDMFKAVYKYGLIIDLAKHTMKTGFQFSAFYKFKDPYYHLSENQAPVINEDGTRASIENISDIYCGLYQCKDRKISFSDLIKYY